MLLRELLSLMSRLPVDSWADHPYYDDLEHEEGQQATAVPDDACEGKPGKGRGNEFDRTAYDY